MQEKGFSSHNSYSLSKLAMMMYTFDLSEIMDPKGVTVNCLDPGTVNTKMLIAGQGVLHFTICCRKEPLETPYAICHLFQLSSCTCTLLGHGLPVNA